MPAPKRSGTLPYAYFTRIKRGKLANPWRSFVRIGERRTHLGYFATEQAAHDAAIIARHNHHRITHEEAV